MWDISNPLLLKNYIKCFSRKRLSTVAKLINLHWRNLEITYSYKPSLNAIYQMTFIVITNRSNFCQYKMRQNYYRSRHIYQKSERLLQIGANITNRCLKHVFSGRVIFIEIEDHNYGFLNNQFLQYREGQLPSTSLILEVLEAATRTGIHRRCFLGDYLLGTIPSPEASRNCLWWSHFLIKTQDQCQPIA